MSTLKKLLFILVVTMLPMASWADDVAKIGETGYASLQAAIAAAADGATVTLIDNVNIDEIITIEKSLTIDVNGKTVTNNVTDGRAITIGNNGDVTIDATVAGSAFVIPASNTNSYGFFRVDGTGCSLTINGGSWTGDTNNGAFIRVGNDVNATVNLNNLTAETNYRFVACGSYTWSNLIVKGGTYTHNNKEVRSNGGVVPAFYLAGFESEFDGVTITSQIGSCVGVTGYMPYTKAVFKNNTFRVAETSSDQSWNNVAISVDTNGEAIVESGTYDGGAGYGAYIFTSGGKLTVNGGTFTGEKAALRSDFSTKTYGKYGWTAEAVINDGTFNGPIATNNDAAASIEVSGGSFDRNVDSKFLADGATLSFVDGKYVAEQTYVAKIGENYYATLEEAIAAVGAGETVKVLSDIEIESSLEVAEGKSFTLDMNGKKISAASTWNSLYAIINRGTLTVTGDGTIDMTTSHDYGCGAFRNFGILTIENGTYLGHIYAGGAAVSNREGGNVTINGGYYEAFRAFDNLAGCTATLNGGEFKSLACKNNVSTGTLKYSYAVCSAGTIEINDGVTINGTHGALAITAGTATINGGSFNTIECTLEGHTCGKKSGFYALYVAGEYGVVTATVNGGEFYSIYRNAVLVGNDNDGGDKQHATTIINDGTFKTGRPTKMAAIKGAAKTGDPIIYGGSFNTAVPAEYCATGFEPEDNGDGTYGVKEIESVNVTISAAGMATFCANADLDFTGTGVTAYIAEGASDIDGNNIMMTPVTLVPAGTGVLLKAEAGDYTIPVATEVTTVENNLLVGTLVACPAPTAEGYEYYYLTNQAEGIANAPTAFYLIPSGMTMAAGKAYLKVPVTVSVPEYAEGGARLNIIFADEVTGIKDIDAVATGNNAVYDLQGRRVANPTRGLYIVNGKKVVLK